MKVSEPNLEITQLTRIEQLTGGNQGEVFLLESDCKEKLVVKFQNDSPVGARVGTHILHKAGVLTPEIRPATATELEYIATKLGQMPPGQCDTARAAFAAAKKKLDKGKAEPSKSGGGRGMPPKSTKAAVSSKYRHVLLMDFADGRSLNEMQDPANVEEYLKVLLDRRFGVELGKILAADAVAGNNDRLSGAWRGPTLLGWVHPNNTLVTSNRKPVAIDNGFRPALMVPNNFPWGTALESSLYEGSIASASKLHATKEAGLLLDTLLSKVLERHPKENPESRAKLQASLGEFKEKNQDAFVAAVAEGASDTMKKLLVHGQRWAQSLLGLGADGELVKQFRIRKRLLRQVSAGVDPQASLARAKNVNEYRQWYLTEQLKMPKDAAEALLQTGVQAYKDYKKQHPKI